MIDFETFRFHPSATTNHATAVVGTDRSLSWQELAHEVNTLQQTFARIELQGPVVLYGHKQADMLVAMLACMLHQVPYIPVDTQSTPRERLLQYATNANAQLVLDFSGDLDTAGTRWIHKEEELPVHGWLHHAWSGPKDVDDRVYILFTSGSTGQPKGVQINREAIRCFVDWLKADFPFCDDEVFMNQAPLNFDLSCYEVFASLALGGTLVLASASLSNDAYLALARKHAVTTWVSTPSFVRKFAANRQFNAAELPSIRTFLFCGETLPVRTFERLQYSFQHAAIINSYGPTEATVACTQINLAESPLVDRGALAVGSPIAAHTIAIRNTQGFLDFSENTSDGEIVITGDNVSVGYLGLHTLNQEKFFLHDGRRAFNTGDQGYKKDGTLYFIGRDSGFVKLHGYRIEPGEVAGALELCEGIVAAAVVPIVLRGEVKRLVGFVVPAAENLDLASVMVALRTSIPEYMVPSEIIPVEQLPMNANGKLDTSKLLTKAGFNV